MPPPFGLMSLIFPNGTVSTPFEIWFWFTSRDDNDVDSDSRGSLMSARKKDSDVVLKI
jgi:hypothetical protein